MMENNLAPIPTRATARRDLYKVASVTLAIVTVAGFVVALVSLVAPLGSGVARTAVLVALLALAAHVAISMWVGKPPHIELDSWL